MNGGFTAWLKTLIGDDGSRAGESTPEPEPREPVALFSCQDCDTTYICEEMEACPECGQGVESVPNERELGLT